MPQIEVMFDIDANGILSVSAKDKGTGKEQKIVIQSSSGLDKAEVATLIKEAETHAEEDRRKREEVELRNAAESMTYNAEKMLREQAEHVPDDLKQEVEEKIAAVRSALQANDHQTLQSAADDLQESLQKIGQHVYSKAAADGAPGQTEAPEAPDEAPSDGEDTVEGEFREV